MLTNKKQINYRLSDDGDHQIASYQGIDYHLDNDELLDIEDSDERKEEIRYFYYIGKKFDNSRSVLFLNTKGKFTGFDLNKLRKFKDKKKAYAARSVIMKYCDRNVSLFISKHKEV